MTSRNNKETFYGICLSNATCHTNKKKNYQLYRGDLVKINKHQEQGFVLSVFTEKIKLYGCLKDFSLIDEKLCYLLHSIKDRDERIAFYNDGQRRDFVLHLKKNDVVCVSINKKDLRATVHEITTKKNLSFIDVEIWEENKVSRNRSKSNLISVSPNMVSKLTFTDLDQKITENLNIDKSKWVCDVCFDETLKDINKCRKCSNPKGNHFGLSSQAQTSSGSRESGQELILANDSNKRFNGSSASVLLETTNQSIISEQNNVKDTTAEDLEKTGSSKYLNQPSISKSSEVHEIRRSPQSVPTSLRNHTLKLDQQKFPNCKVVNPIDSTPWDCKVCFTTNINEKQTCMRCDEPNYKEIPRQFNSQTDIDPILLVSSNLHTRIPLNPFDTVASNNMLTNADGDLMEHCDVPVIFNSSINKCQLCENPLVEQPGYIFNLCQHTICETCINNQINHSGVLKCIVSTNQKVCNRQFLLCEIKMILNSEQYEHFRTRLIESNESNYYIKRCYNTNCDGYHLFEKFYEAKPIKFLCNNCKLFNCIKCKVIHDGLTCIQYGKLTDDGKSVDKETVEMFLNWIREGKAMPCPKCETLIEKDEGCDWVQCSFCFTEICWATRGPRWGPAGSGDTSGGCGCTKEKKCTELCNYCH